MVHPPCRPKGERRLDGGAGACPRYREQRLNPPPPVITSFMGLIESLRRWLEERPPKRPPPEYHPQLRSQEEEDEEIAELIAIDII